MALDREAQMAKIQKYFGLSSVEPEEDIDHYSVNDLMMKTGIDVSSINSEIVKQAYKLSIAVMGILGDKRVFHRTRLDIYSKDCNIDYTQEMLAAVKEDAVFAGFIAGSNDEDHKIERYLLFNLDKIINNFDYYREEEIRIKILEITENHTYHFIRILLHEYGHYKEDYISDREGIAGSYMKNNFWLGRKSSEERMAEKGLYPYSNSKELFAEYFSWTNILPVIKKLEERDPSLLTCLDKYAKGVKDKYDTTI